MKTLFALIPAIVLASLLVWKWTEAEKAKATNVDLAAQVKVLEEKLAAPGETTGPGKRPSGDKTAGESSAEVASATEDSKKAKNPMAEMGKAWMELMNSDTGKEIMTYMTKLGVEGVYKDLLDLMDLPDDKRAAVGAILSQMKSAQDMQWVKFMDPSLSEDDKKKLVADLKASHESYQQKIKDALGDEAKFKQYQQFQDSEPERMSVGMLKGALEAKGLSFSEQQEQQTLDTLYNQRKGMKWDHDYAAQHDADPAKFTPEALARYETQVAEYDQKVGSQLSGILDEQQLQTYNTQREGWRKFEQVWLNMAQAFFKKPE